MTPEGRKIHRTDDGGKTALSWLSNLTYGVQSPKSLICVNAVERTFDFAWVGLVQQNHLSAGDLCSDENGVAARDHEHAIHKSGSGSCCFALCWIGSVHRAGLRDDAHSLRSSRAYSRTRHWARFKHLPQLSLITFGYEPATTCRTERKAKRPR